jgi:hypothetical protein
MLAPAASSHPGPSLRLALSWIMCAVPVIHAERSAPLDESSQDLSPASTCRLPVGGFLFGWQNILIAMIFNRDTHPIWCRAYSGSEHAVEEFV